MENPLEKEKFYLYHKISSRILFSMSPFLSHLFLGDQNKTESLFKIRQFLIVIFFDKTLSFLSINETKY